MNIFANPPVRLNQSINLNFLLVPYDGKSTTQSVKIQDNLNQIWNSPSFVYIRWQFSLYSGRRGWYFSLFHVNSKVNFDDETSNQFESAWGWMENNEFSLFSLSSRAAAQIGVNGGWNSVDSCVSSTLIHAELEFCTEIFTLSTMTNWI